MGEKSTTLVEGRKIPRVILNVPLQGMRNAEHEVGIICDDVSLLFHFFIAQ